MSMQAIGANTSSIMPQGPKQPGRPANPGDTIGTVPGMTIGKETLTLADGRQVTILKENKLMGEYTISIAEKKKPGMVNIVAEQPTVRVVSKKEFDELINGKEKKPFSIEPRTFNSQETGRSEGLGENLSLIA